MKTVAHIITGLNVGGAERALHTLLTGGLEGAFRNIVVSLMDEGHYGPLLRAAGIPVYCLGLKRGRISISALMQMRKVMRQERPELLQGWMYHGNTLATIAQIQTRNHARLVWNIRTSLDSMADMSHGSRAMIRIGRWLSSRADAIVYNSQRSRGQHATLGFPEGTATVLPNAFDLQRWAPSPATRRDIRAELGLDANDLVVGYVGRNNIMKDPDNLFAALESVLTRHAGVQVVIAGQDLAQAAPQTLGATGRVHFLGKRTDVPKLMTAFDLLCLSSRVEGFPNVVGEAMASGVPCVATDVGDVAAIMRDTGWVVPPRDSTALANALIEALNEAPAKRQQRGAEARQVIEQRYSRVAIVERYSELYQHCVKARGHHGQPASPKLL